MKRSILIASGAVVLVLLSAGAAFVGGRLLGSPDVSSDKQGVIVSDSSGEATTSAVIVETEPAAEMPDAPSDAWGIFVRREDNSLFLGTGSTSAVKVDGKWELHHDGPVVEVVATHDTLVYRDDTLRLLGGVAPSGPVEQVLKPNSLDEVGENTTVQAWGEKRGDRVIAEVIIFSDAVY